MDLRLHLFLGQQHGPQSPIWPPVASGTTVVLQGGPVQQVNLSFSQASILAQGQGDPEAQQQVLGLSLCLDKLQAALLHPTDSTGQ